MPVTKTKRYGIKGHKAGRKGFYDEAMVKKIVNCSNSIVLETLEGKGVYADIPVEVRVEIACRFSLKAVPQKLESDGSFAPKTIVLVRNDKALEESRNIQVAD